ncbi:MAG: hypothetical protein WBB85_05265, partial [Albidovulum sp.]|uniref:hypothetical protein n=1 Tax=Albidovulum sp. TaxID=1872424 RepID=UPI003CAC7844
MIRRALTDAERTELRESLEANSWSSSDFSVIAFASTAAAAGIYVLGTLCVGVILWGMDQAPTFRAASHSYVASSAGWAAAGIWIVYLGRCFIADTLKTRKHRKRLRLD